MPSINNIGITIDDGDSYNRFLSISLVKYFENCQDAEAVNDISFLKFVSSNEFKDQLDYLDKKHYKIYMQNLLNSFDKQLTKEDVFSTIKGMQQKIADYGFSSKKVSVVNDSLHKLTKDCICKGYDEAIINMSKFYFRDFNHFQAGLQTEEAQEILNFHLSKLESYDQEQGPFRYLEEQLNNLEHNVEKVCDLLQSVSKTDGKDGIKSIFDDFDNIVSNKSEKYDLDLEDVILPFCTNDEPHQVDEFYSPFIAIDYIIERFAFINGVSRSIEYNRNNDKYAEELYNILSLHKGKGVK